MKPRNDGITIIPLTPSRISELTLLDSLCFSDPWSAESFASVLENSLYTYFIAVDSELGNVCGYGGLYSLLDSADIMNIAVLPDYRKRGIGSALLSELISAAKEKGVLSLHLEVRQSNDEAKRLYEKFGFVVDGIRKSYYRRPTEDAILMTKALSSNDRKEF
ncbi:MAG: ribosomal protein S18-alanine N-acetyltransferase [Clostridia bacterium]|nr:ribosomal protein S18-alanine N-acetyltransferase [Clostridia bacterium]